MFPTSQLLVDGFPEPFRHERNRNEGGIMIFANEDMSSKLLQKHVFPVDTERLLIEINFRKSKWLLSPTIHHPKRSILL